MTKGDRQEGALLDSVEELLATTPLAKITLADIASHAGLSRSAVYFYFDNKTALVEAAIVRLLERLLEDFGERTASPEEPLAVSVEKYLASCTAMWQRSTPLLKTAVDLLGQRPNLRAAWEKIMERSAESFAFVIENKRAEGYLPNTGDARAQALAVVWMVERTYYMLYTREHTTQEEENLPAVLTPLILHGIGAKLQ